MPFSHASEHCLQQWLDRLRIGGRPVSETLATVTEALKARKPPKLAELISILIFMCPSFHDVVKALIRPERDAKDFCLETAAFIGGAYVDCDTIAMTQVLSGFVDADRSDY